jgi:hypothetical protein
LLDLKFLIIMELQINSHYCKLQYDCSKCWSTLMTWELRVAIELVRLLYGYDSMDTILKERTNDKLILLWSSSRLHVIICKECFKATIRCGVRYFIEHGESNSGLVPQTFDQSRAIAAHLDFLCFWFLFIIATFRKMKREKTESGQGVL